MRSQAQSFRATIHKKGVNPYIEVPERVSRAFAEHARAGRITVLGTLNRTPIQTTLVPIGGRHRLYVNGGMRSAAGVDVGDRVRIELNPAAPEEVKELAYRDRIGYMVQVRFAGATPYREWLDVAFWLRRRVDSPRFRRVETITPNAQLHVVRIHHQQQLDEEIGELLREAYAAGCQR